MEGTEVLSALETRPGQGLTQAEAERRLARYGLNEYGLLTFRAPGVIMPSYVGKRAWCTVLWR
jgi:magnesium-transporting ATPase (P-type)